MLNRVDKVSFEIYFFQASYLGSFSQEFHPLPYVFLHLHLKMVHRHLSFSLDNYGRDMLDSYVNGR